MRSQEKFSLTWIFQICVIFGYFGVSDTDTDVLLPVRVNFPPASTTNKLRAKEDVKGRIARDEEMRLWDQIFTNALATTNTSQWVYLRQIFDRVEEELHKSRSTGNSSLHLSRLHNDIISHRGTYTDPTTSTVSKLPKFSYHRVMSPLRGRGKPFAAVTLLVADGGGNGGGRKSPKESDQRQNRQEKDHDYQQDHDVSLQDDSSSNNFKHLEKFGNSDDFESFDSTAGVKRMGVSDQLQVEVEAGNGDGDRIPSAFGRVWSHLGKVEHRHHHQARHHHHYHQSRNGHLYNRNHHHEHEHEYDHHHHHHRRYGHKKSHKHNQDSTLTSN